MTIQELRGLISANKTREAVAIMVEKIGNRNVELRDALIMLSSQIARNESLFTMRLIEPRDFGLTEAQTTHGVLATLEEIYAEGYLENGAISEEDIPKKPIMPVDTRCKLLFIAANPHDTYKLQLAREYIEIRKIFKLHQQNFALVEEFDATLESFFEAIFVEKANIIHFSGMADADCIVLTRKNGLSHRVSYEYLAATFKLFRNHAECVFINTMYSDIFAKVVSRFIPYVIGIKGIISDDEAISFAGGFYTSLSFDKDYRKAFKMAKDLLIQERMKRLSPKDVPTSYGIGRDPQVTRKLEIEKVKDIPYVLFMNGVSADENDTTPAEFPVEVPVEIKAKTR